MLIAKGMLRANQSGSLFPSTTKDKQGDTVYVYHVTLAIVSHKPIPEWEDTRGHYKMFDVPWAKDVVNALAFYQLRDTKIPSDNKTYDDLMENFGAL